MTFKTPKFNLSNSISVLLIILIVVPQSRHFIQLQLNKLLSLIPPSIEYKSERKTIKDFNYKLQSLNGESVNLKTIEHKISIINFWATWCPPCVAELPSLQDLYNDYGDRVDFIFISNEEPETIHTFLKKYNYNLPVYIPLEEANDIYFKPRTIPRTLLINKKNEIIIIEEGAKDWNSNKIRRVLDQLINNEEID